MKIELDRRPCNCWDPACEAHFSWHFLREEVTPVDCTLSITEDGSEDLTFLILDRDGETKTLVVTPENRAQVHDSWIKTVNNA